MIRTLSSLRGFSVHSTQQKIGTVHDYLIDDQQWRIQFLMISPLEAEGGQDLILPSSALSWTDAERKTFVVRDAILAGAPEGMDALRSFDQVTGYSIQARDGGIGRVEDFLVDDENWALLYLIVDTGGLINRKKVFLSPSTIEKVNWHEKRVDMDLKRQTIQNSPQWDPESTISPEFSERIDEYYKKNRL